MKTDLESPSATPGQIDSFWVLGARLTWVLLGPLALVLISAGIVSSGTGWLTPLDAGFAVAAGLMLFGRWVEIRSGSATTFTGEPAGAGQFGRYARALVPGAAVLWVAANVVGNHVLA